MRPADQWTNAYPVAEFWFIWWDDPGLPECPTAYITLGLMISRISWHISLRRLGVVAVCLSLSGLAVIFALIGLNLTISRYGVLALLVLLAWILAIAALGVLSVTWVLGRRIGRRSAIACCVLGTIAMLAFPVLWPRDFAGALVVELLLTSPSVLLAIHLARFHSIDRERGLSRWNGALIEFSNPPEPSFLALQPQNRNTPEPEQYTEAAHGKRDAAIVAQEMFDAAKLVP